MSMSKGQSAAYWRLWSAACKAQGWTKAEFMDSAAIVYRDGAWICDFCDRIECKRRAA